MNWNKLRKAFGKTMGMLGLLLLFAAVCSGISFALVEWPVASLIVIGIAIVIGITVFFYNEA